MPEPGYGRGVHSRGGSSLLLVTHVALRDGPNGLLIDDQTASGIRQWSQHFGHVTFYGIAARTLDESQASAAWIEVGELEAKVSCRVRSLPRAYRVGAMLRGLSSVRKVLREEVRNHQHLCFTIGGLVGDWPAVAALEAARQGRKFAAWIDRVEPVVLRNRVADDRRSRRLAAAVLAPSMEVCTRFILRRSHVALLQGRDTYDHYERYASDPHCTYDTHTTEGDQIAPGDLSRKCAKALAGQPLEITYVGRAAVMKGTYDWIETLRRIHAAQVPFRASWLGDGPELQSMKDQVAAAGLAGVVDLRGFVGDRATVLAALRSSDVLLFCHKTPESPRTLIESLVSGCAITGYDSAYPRGLVEQSGGGVFVPQDDFEALADSLVQLHHDRARLARLIGEAAQSGSRYTEDIVYAHRADLMKRA